MIFVIFVSANRPRGKRGGGQRKSEWRGSHKTYLTKRGKILEGSRLDNFGKTIVCKVAERMKLLHPSTHNTVHVVEEEILVRCVSSHHKEPRP